MATLDRGNVPVPGAKGPGHASHCFPARPRDDNQHDWRLAAHTLENQYQIVLLDPTGVAKPDLSACPPTAVVRVPALHAGVFASHSMTAMEVNCFRGAG